MQLLLILLVIVLNFIISWANASYCGRYWTVSKREGGSFRRYVIVGYVMASAGFTIVYGYVLILLMPYVLQIVGMEASIIMQVEKLATDLLYVLEIALIIPTGFYIWVRSMKNAWDEKTTSTILNAGWNTYAQFQNTVNVAKNMPSVFGRIEAALFDDDDDGNNNDKHNIVIFLAIFLIILILFAGVCTATAIINETDFVSKAFLKENKKKIL